MVKCDSHPDSKILKPHRLIRENLQHCDWTGCIWEGLLFLDAETVTFSLHAYRIDHRNLPTEFPTFLVWDGS